ncbi:MAG: SAM-dependent methyltransferase [Bacteroidota bacterium]|nr:SAM-dependent methyltransferase [Bacteroidota bacterium]MDP4274195.1 SAM-dependent methyltransferase [Bacteroidota bacterium]
MSGKLYLIPNTLGEYNIDQVIPAHVKNIVNTLDYFVVENERTARRYLSRMGISKPIDQLFFTVLDEHSRNEEVESMLAPLFKNFDVGIISEAGVPAVADPGSALVNLAHKHQIQVIPLVGPSSIILSLMASGLNGQNFAFRGYLKIKKEERLKQIRMLEKCSQVEKQTQIFIETPYRNEQLFDDLVSNCQPETLLCIAADITLSTEFISTKAIKEWKKKKPDIKKRPAIFLLQRY